MARSRQRPATHIHQLASETPASIRLYYFTAKQWGMKALWEKRLKVSRYSDSIDLFELAGFARSRPKTRDVLDARLAAMVARDEGRLCFSDRWKTLELWSVYADRHRGMCLGFDVRRDRLQRVQYVSRPPELPTLRAARKRALDKAIFWKSKVWSHEREWQRIVPLKQAHDGIYFQPFDESLHLREVILGARCTLNPIDVVDAVTNPPLDVEIFKARPAHDRFEVCRQELIDTHLATGFRATLAQAPDVYISPFHDS